MKINFNPIFKLNNKPQLQNFKASYNNQLPFDIFIKSQKEEETPQNFADEMYQLLVQGIDVSPEVERALRDNISAYLWLESAAFAKRIILEGRISLERYKEISLADFDEHARKTIQETLENSGITTPQEFANLEKIYNDIKSQNKNYEKMGLNIIEAYGLLKNPKELPNFPGLILKALTLNQDYDLNLDLDNFATFAKSIGLKNEDAFFKKFWYLGKDFGEYQNTTDMFVAFEYISSTYPEKREVLEKIIQNNPQFKKTTPEMLYSQFSHIIDWLYEQMPENWEKKAERIIKQAYKQERFSQNTIETLAPEIEIRKISGEIALWDYLYQQNITSSELNSLLKPSIYAGVEPLDCVKNKEDITDIIRIYGAMSTDEADEYYLRFAQTLNALYKIGNYDYQSDGIESFLDICKKFDIKDDKDFLKFYMNFEKIEQPKNKKSQQKEIKITKKDVRDLVEILNFANSEIIQKYKKDKHYPLKAELKKREEFFNKNKEQISQGIKEQGFAYIAHNPYRIFTKYGDLIKTNGYIPLFITDTVKEIIAQINCNKKDEEVIFEEFVSYFKDVNQLGRFLFKNQIKIDTSKETKTCLRIAKVLLENKEGESLEATKQALFDNNFIKNSKANLVKFARRKNDEELRLVFETILRGNIDNIAQINTLLNKYSNSDKEFSSFLNHFISSNLDLEEYLKRIEQLQKDFINAGIPIVINNDTIQGIDINEIQGKTKLPKLIAIAKNITNPNDEFNFILSLPSSRLKAKQPIIPRQVAREIFMGEKGRYEEGFTNLLKEFDLSEESLSEKYFKNLIKKRKYSKTQPSFNYEAQIESNIDKKLISLLNSKLWQIQSEEKTIYPNLSLHAKLRLLDRFILNNGYDLYSTQAQEEIQGILNTIYTQTPSKMVKSNRDDDSFHAYFIHNDYEIKAVFEKSGKLLTIAKNEL